ncbi:MAG: MFS transporter [Rhodospirillales bacterium]|nr:MFS transporter [Rhodospirillales bacterium]
MSLPRRGPILLVLLIGGFLPPVDVFIVNVALPSIRAGLGAGPAGLELVISGYAAAYAVFLVTGGRLGDLYGRRRMFLLAMAGFTATSVLCGIARSIPTLVAARILEGVAAAMLVPQVLGAIRALHDGPGQEAQLARAIGLYGVMVGLAAATGQLAGGVLIALSPFGLGWRAVFLINLPIGAAAILGGIVLLPEAPAEARPRLDLVGAALLSLALAALLVPLAEGRELGWPPWTLATLGAAPLLAAGFVRFEAARARSGGMPLFDPRLLANAPFRRGLAVAALFFFTSAFYLLFAVERQDGAGLGPLGTGLSILPYGIGLFLGPLATGRLVPRLGARLLAIGLGIEVAGYAATGAAVAFGWPRAPLALLVLLAGFGQGIALPRLFNLVLGAVPARQAGVAAGAVNSVLQIGASVSVAAIGSLFFAVLGDAHGAAAYAHAFGIAMIAVTAALATAWALAAGGRRT